jgi:hypothetical protein
MDILLLSKFGDTLQINKLKGGVARGFYPNHFSVRFDSLDNIVQVSHIYKVEFNTEFFFAKLSHILLGACINIVTHK